MDQPSRIDVAVIGAGIIGIACAFQLQAAGRSVVLIDRKGLAEETSRGNAGAFAFSDIIPLAGSGVLGQAARMAQRSLGTADHSAAISAADHAMADALLARRLARQGGIRHQGTKRSDAPVAPGGQMRWWRRPASRA